MPKSKVALIMAGGTGGHVFPALAVAKKLQKKGWTVEWLGSAGGIETRLVPEQDILIHEITVSGLRGKGIVKLLMAPFLLLRSVIQAFGVLRKARADLVVGFGGFASGPGGLAAWLTRTPLLIHEQNAIAGLTNKVLSRFAKKSCVAFEDALGVSSVWVGNPVREEICNIEMPEQRNIFEDDRLNILVLGGSLGAVALNELVPEALAKVKHAKVTIVHQCGRDRKEKTDSLYQSLGLNASVYEFVNDMPAKYSAADLVICRAGALTVSELACVGVASILVPYPFAVDDHQTFNAEVLAGVDAAIIMQQKTLSADLLAKQIDQIIEQDQLLPMAKAARTKAKVSAADDVAMLCESVV